MSYSRVLFRMILSDLLFNDANHRAASLQQLSFLSAMHKSDLAITACPSVRLSVYLSV